MSRGTVLAWPTTSVCASSALCAADAQRRHDTDELQVELEKVLREIDQMSRNIAADELEQMKNGMPRDGAGALENEVRRRYARVREIEGMLGIVDHP